MSEETIYTKWEDIPEGVATKTTLYRDYRLKVSKDQQPVARKKRYNHRGKHVGYYDLYAADDCEPVKKATGAQLSALEKAQYMAERLPIVCVRCNQTKCNQYGDAVTVTRKNHQENYENHICFRCRDRRGAIQWARELLASEDFVILDTETSDLDGEIIEIGIADAQGNELLNQRIKPVGTINAKAQAIHGLSIEMLEDEPSFPDVYNSIISAINGKTVVIYNASFDMARLRADCQRHNLDVIEFEYACAMEWYSQWFGQWNDYHNSYRWQRLPGGDHSAFGDCIATLGVIKEMAESSLDYRSDDEN